MAVCPNCSAQQPDGAAFCDECGAQIGGVAPVPSAPAPLAAAPAPPTPTAIATTCSVCGASVPAGEAFCDNCGAALGQAAPAPVAAPAAGGQPCPSCGAQLEPGSNFCDMCGATIGAPAPPPAPAAAPPPPAPAPPPPVAAPVPAPVPAPVAAPAPAPAGVAAVPGKLVVQGTSASLPFPPGKTEIFVGREDPVSGVFPELDLTDHGGDEGGVSRKHARIYVQGNQVYIEDLNSTNYTYVNQQKVTPGQPCPVNDGDELRFGRVKTNYYSS